MSSIVVAFSWKTTKAMYILITDFIKYLLWEILDFHSEATVAPLLLSMLLAVFPQGIEKLVL
jgi:hypothetical protein